MHQLTNMAHQDDARILLSHSIPECHLLRVIQAGKKLSRYEVEKRRAVEEEDYDMAALKKIQMDEHRLSVYQGLRVHDLLDLDPVSLLLFRSATMYRLLQEMNNASSK